VEEELALALPIFEGLNEAERNALRSKNGPDLFAKLVTFSVRMAAKALQTKHESFLTAGLIALAVDEDQLDCPDLYRALAALFDAGNRISARAEDILRRVSRCATPGRADDMINGFVSGPIYMRLLHSMGIELVDMSGASFYRFRRMSE
jgi:hypothetical protein